MVFSISSLLWATEIKKIC